MIQNEIIKLCNEKEQELLDKYYGNLQVSTLVARLLKMISETTLLSLSEKSY